MLFDKNPIPFLNSRLREQGINATPEQRNAHPQGQKNKYWEVCLNHRTDSGYANDNKYKPPININRDFLLNVIGNGGNPCCWIIGPKGEW